MSAISMKKKKIFRNESCKIKKNMEQKEGELKHADTCMVNNPLSPTLSSPSKECPSADMGLEPNNASVLKHQCVCFAYVFSSHPETMSAARGRRESGTY